MIAVLRQIAHGAAAGVLTIAAAGCGNLTVTMDVLNPAAIERNNEEALIASGLTKLSTASDETVNLIVRDLQATHRQGYVRMRDIYLAEAAKESGAAGENLKKIANDLPGAFDRNTSSYYGALRGDLLRYRDDLNTILGGRYSIAPQDPGYRQVVNILKKWDSRLRQVATEVKADLGRRATAEKDKTTKAVLADAADVTVAQVQADLAQVSIQNSPFAHAVANAPEADWSPRYNKVYSTGQFGASDVAIKLDPHTGNYLLKGLSFDPSDVAAVAAKMTTQALLLTAQISGVPVKTSSAPMDGTPGKALAVSSSALVGAQASIEARRAQDQTRRAALISLANVILSEESELSGDDARRKAAVKAIRDAFEARRPLLLPLATP